MTRSRAGLAAAALVLAGLTGCGSETLTTRAVSLPALAPPPATVPADYVSVGALESQLRGAAFCTGNGPGSALCNLRTTTTNVNQIALIQPFQIKVLPTPQAVSGYLRFVRGANEARAETGSAVRDALTGPHWVVVPQTTTAGLLTTLRGYLGGTIVS